MRLERDAADARLKELEERARLAKLHLEETRDRHANEDATLMKRLDAREKAFRESCIDDPEEELAHQIQNKQSARQTLCWAQDIEC